MRLAAHHAACGASAQDAGTGIQPFLPPRAAAGGGGLRSAGRIVKYVLVGPLLAVLRLVLGAIVLVWLLTFSTIGNAVRRPPAPAPALAPIRATDFGVAHAVGRSR